MHFENQFLRHRFTWHIIPWTDPDEANLMKAGLRRIREKKYSKNLYRNVIPLQTDWTFPLKYRNHIFNDLPSNIIALARLFEHTRPLLVYPIHNSGMTGT